MVLHIGGRKNIPQLNIARRIALAQPMPDGVTEHAPAKIMNTSGNVDCTTAFNAPNYRNKIGCRNLSDSPRTNPWENVILKKRPMLGPRRIGKLDLGVPLRCDGFKTICTALCPRRFDSLPFCTREWGPVR